MKARQRGGRRTEFNGKYLYALHAHEIGKNRCKECYFDGRFDCCAMLDCDPLMHDDVIYRRSKKGYKTY